MTNEDEALFKDTDGKLEAVREVASYLGRPELALEVESVRLKFQIEWNQRKLAELDRV